MCHTQLLSLFKDILQESMSYELCIKTSDCKDGSLEIRSQLQIAFKKVRIFDDQTVFHSIYMDFNVNFYMLFYFIVYIILYTSQSHSLKEMGDLEI